MKLSRNAWKYVSCMLTVSQHCWLSSNWRSREIAEHGKGELPRHGINRCRSLRPPFIRDPLSALSFHASGAGNGLTVLQPCSSVQYMHSCSSAQYPGKSQQLIGPLCELKSFLHFCLKSHCVAVPIAAHLSSFQLIHVIFHISAARPNG